MAITEQQQLKLIQAANAARSQAYCPYSGFAVGSALLTASGGMHTGCNVENVSYGLSVCAERNTVAAAVAAGMQPGELAVIAVAVDADEPATPCGACRQVIAEFAADDCVVICVNLQGKLKVIPLAQLLPDAFRLDERD